MLFTVLAILFFVFITSHPEEPDEEPNPQKGDLAGANKEKLVTVAEYLHLVDAESSRMALESEDIESYLADENIIWMDPLYSPAVGGSKSR